MTTYPHSPKPMKYSSELLSLIYISKRLTSFINEGQSADMLECVHILRAEAFLRSAIAANELEEQTINACLPIPLQNHSG